MSSSINCSGTRNYPYPFRKFPHGLSNVLHHQPPIDECEGHSPHPTRAGIVLLSEKGNTRKILLVKGKIPPGGGSPSKIGVPKGAFKPSDLNIKFAALREFHEETGVRLDVRREGTEKIIGYRIFKPYDIEFSNESHYYLFVTTTRSEMELLYGAQPQSGEITNLGFMNIQTLKSELADPRFSCKYNRALQVLAEDRRLHQTFY